MGSAIGKSKDFSEDMMDDGRWTMAVTARGEMASF
jgi:hypothetical protein